MKLLKLAAPSSIVGAGAVAVTGDPWISVISAAVTAILQFIAYRNRL